MILTGALLCLFLLSLTICRPGVKLLAVRVLELNRFLHTTIHSTTFLFFVKHFCDFRQFLLSGGLSPAIITANAGMGECYMSEGFIESGGISDDDEMERIDALIAVAAAAIDAGDYRGAVDGFRQALLHARQYLGQSHGLTEIEKTIDDVEGLLE